MEQSIAIVENNFIPLAFVRRNEGGMTVHTQDDEVKKSIKDILTVFERVAPRQRTESFDDKKGWLVGSREVEKTAPEYLSAVAEELRAFGLRAFIIPSMLEETMQRIGKADIGREERKEAIGNMIYAPEPEIEEIAAFTRKLAELEARAE